MQLVQFKEPIVAIKFTPENSDELDNILNSKEIRFLRLPNVIKLYQESLDPQGQRRVITCYLNQTMIFLPYLHDNLSNIMVVEGDVIGTLFEPIN